ncbi:MAG: hypothetical protein NTZ09_20910, partial [Candidatus Hydrogenedentes bacterium]|nr:hypothetical protein [Candidatus Hydrogenedentota bacterium]
MFVRTTLLRKTFLIGAGICLVGASFPCGAETPSVNDLPALGRAIEDLSRKFPEQYVRGPEFLKRLEVLEKQTQKGEDDAAEKVEKLRREALLANPLLDFQQIFVVKRGEKQLGLPQNWQGNCSLPPRGYDNEIGVLSLAGEYHTLYRPENGSFVGDVDLH